MAHTQDISGVDRRLMSEAPFPKLSVRYRDRSDDDATFAYFSTGGIFLATGQLSLQSSKVNVGHMISSMLQHQQQDAL